jgi:excisionase family DNA binding protein
MADTPETPRRYITTAEAARRLSVDTPFIRQLLGVEVEGARFGRVFKVDAASLEAYRERQTLRPPQS